MSVQKDEGQDLPRPRRAAASGQNSLIMTLCVRMWGDVLKGDVDGWMLMQWCSRWRRASVLSFSAFYEQLPARSPSGSETSEKQPSALLRENWTQISWEKMEYNHKYLFFLPSFHPHSYKNTPAVKKLPSTSSLPSLWSTWSFFEVWFMTCSAEVEHGWSSDLLIFFKIEKWSPGLIFNNFLPKNITNTGTADPGPWQERLVVFTKTWSLLSTAARFYML